MSLLYRCLWTDREESDRRGVVDLARDCFSRWALEDPTAISLPDGHVEVGSKRISTSSVSVDANYGFEGIARDVTPESATWTVSVRVLANEHALLVWVDLDMETSDPAKKVKIGRPGIVGELLKLPGKPCLGVSNIQPQRVDISAPEVPLLVDLLRSSDRTLPFVVFSSGPGISEPRRLDIAGKLAVRAAGVVTVLTLDLDATFAFRSALGSLAVWGGAARIYMPAPLEAEADGWRHRYILTRRLALPGTATVDGLVYAAAQLSTRRRVPSEFQVFTGSPEGRHQSIDFDLLEERWKFDLDLAHEERGEVEQELARANGHLDRLRRSLRERGLMDLYWGALHGIDEAADLPESVQCVSDAVAAAELYLTEFLSIHPNASRDLEGIDSAPNSYSLGNTAWRGLRALAAYAQAKGDGFAGNFWIWCERGGPLAWPATSKKLAMQESETVMKGRLAETRVFDISSEVGGASRMTMEAHLKISEGGGDLAPRVYFHDDSDGNTRKVHVGFVGPHYLVPNTQK
jgi:hypothetical protein